MKTCQNCNQSGTTGAMQGFADSKKVKVKDLNYTFCSLKHEYKKKHESCKDFEK
ncbi:MAG: hypothetical protein NXI00_12250 [Cytophagales bacterium]|nr:hypothetical protein [Cytophagales bacterium]